MKYSKTILCLANSRKPSGRCIAGLERIDDSIGGWVRPVSDRTGREISAEEMKYEDGTEAAVGDIIKIEMSEHAPRGCHVEDHLIDDGYYWKKLKNLIGRQSNLLLTIPGRRFGIVQNRATTVLTTG